VSERLSPDPEQAPAQPIAVLDLAKHRLVELGIYTSETFPEALNGADFEKVGLPIFGGCEVCMASVAAYNAYPTQTGYLRCEDCTDDLGYATAEEANAAIFGGGDVA